MPESTQIIAQLQSLQVGFAIMQSQLSFVIAWLGALTGVMVSIGLGAIANVVLRGRNGKRS